MDTITQELNQEATEDAVMDAMRSTNASLTRDDLASMTGLSHFHLSKALRSLRQGGRIRFEKTRWKLC